MSAIELERGAAGIVVELRDSEITIRHIDDGALLRAYPKVSLGTWELMFDTITELLEGRKTK